MGIRKAATAVVAGLALGVFSTVSALDMSAGISGSFATDFGGGMGDKSSNPWIGGGFNAFFDITYAEIGVGMAFAAMDSKYDGDKLNDESTSLMYLNFSALGKYPIALASNMTLAPMVGIDYALCLSAKYDGNDIFEHNDDYDAIDMSQFWIKLGAGMDIALNEKIYIRPALLYGIGFPSKINSDAADAANVDANISHGLTIKAGIGYRF